VAVLTVSQSAASDITRLLRVPPSQVHVVGNGVHPDVRPVQDRAQLAAVPARYGLPHCYVLYLGGFEPRKNVDRLVEAYALLPEAVQDRCALVLAGNSQREQPALEALASRLGVQHRLVLPGVIAENDKPAVLGAACIRFSVPVRRLWPALAGGDGVRHTGARVQRVVLTRNCC
jgi:glycosyltransferase involved in cell wall biosynthesis